LDPAELDYGFAYGNPRVRNNRRGCRCRFVGSPQGFRRMINWKLAGNPLNWLIVCLMAYIGLFGAKIAADYVNSKKDA
jgi:hypothetical protein